jgi:hypothetical protein
MSRRGFFYRLMASESQELAVSSSALIDETIFDECAKMGFSMNRMRLGSFLGLKKKTNVPCYIGLC